MRPDVEAAYPVRMVAEDAATPRVVYDGLVLVPVVRPRPRARDAARGVAPDPQRAAVLPTPRG